MPRGKSGSSQPFQRLGSKNWYIRYSVPGEKVERTESTHTPDERKARQILARKQTEANEGKIGPRGVTVGNLLDLYLEDKRKAGKPPASAEGYVRLHLRPAFGNLIAEQITTDHIDRFIAMKKTAGKANASINRWLEALNRAYTIGRDERDPQLVRKTPKINMLDETGNVREGFLTSTGQLRREVIAIFYFKSIGYDESRWAGGWGCDGMRRISARYAPTPATKQWRWPKLSPAVFPGEPRPRR